MNTFKFKGFPLTTLGLTLCLAITMGASGPAAVGQRDGAPIVAGDDLLARCGNGVALCAEALL